MKEVRSDPRKRRSGQTRGLYFVGKSGNGAPLDNQGTFCSKFQEDARDASWRGLPDGRRDLPTAAPPLSSGSPSRRPHTPDTPPARASVRDRPRPTQLARGRPPRRRGDQPHPPPRARVWVSPPAAAPPVARDMAWSEAPPPPRRRGGSVDGGPARCGAPLTPPPRHCLTVDELRRRWERERAPAAPPPPPLPRLPPLSRPPSPRLRRVVAATAAAAAAGCGPWPHRRRCRR